LSVTKGLDVRTSGGTMLTDFFVSGRTTEPSASVPGVGLRSAAALVRLTRLDRLGGFDRLARRAEPDEPAPGAKAPDALSAASEAERLKRLRASFEDDLAHFLRGASSSSAD